MTPFTNKAVPPFPGWLAALGPGIVWMALAQGSGELIWWPYLCAKYGLGFLFLLAPACLIQWPLNYEIGRYTLLTGESIWQGFIRLNRTFAFFLWCLMILSFLWFGAFASAGGTALAALTNFPPNFSQKAQSLFWGYLTILIFFCALVFSRVVYSAVEKFMTAVAVITLGGLFSALFHPKVTAKIPEFLRAIFSPVWPENRSWDPNDATILLTAITFAGLGGFWTLFYSYWLKEKGAGMSRYSGRITSPITGKAETISESGFIPDFSVPPLFPLSANTPSRLGRDTPFLKDESASPTPPVSKGNWGEGEIKKWLKFLVADSGIGVMGNLLTTFLTCLLAYALLFPEGLVPKEWEIAVVQSKFFELQWGTFGRLLFLLVAAAFLSDTWMATADAVSRVNTDITYGLFSSARKYSHRFWYYLFLIVGTAVTCVTMFHKQPGDLILISAVMGFVGTVIFSVAVLILNHFYLPQFSPSLKPKKMTLYLMSLSVLVYFVLMLAYLWAKWF